MVASKQHSSSLVVAFDICKFGGILRSSLVKSSGSSGGHVSASAKCCDSVCAGEAEVAVLGSWARCSVAAAVAGL